MPSLQKRYFFGLKEAKKAIESGSAKSVILATNIEQLDLLNESADHQMAEMLKKSKDKVTNSLLCESVLHFES